MICAHLGEPKEIEILVKGYVFNAKSNLEPSKGKECVAGLTNPTALQTRRRLVHQCIRRTDACFKIGYCAFD
jgi:hypothetical protein